MRQKTTLSRRPAGTGKGAAAATAAGAATAAEWGAGAGATEANSASGASPKAIKTTRIDITCTPRLFIIILLSELARVARDCPVHKPLVSSNSNVSAKAANFPAGSGAIASRRQTYKNAAADNASQSCLQFAVAGTVGIMTQSVFCVSFPPKNAPHIYIRT